MQRLEPSPPKIGGIFDNRSQNHGGLQIQTGGIAMFRKAFLTFVGFLVLVSGYTITYADFNGGGRYKIASRFSGKALDVAGASTDNGANIQLWSYGGGSNQH
ncbi:MAG: RICIN domain-containing protein, partial [Desulfobacteraceae bacterium]